MHACKRYAEAFAHGMHTSMTCTHPRVINRYFGTQEQFAEARRKVWQRELAQYVATLAPNVRQELARDIQPLLKERSITL